MGTRQSDRLRESPSETQVRRDGTACTMTMTSSKAGASRVLRDGRTPMTDMEARRFVEDYVFPPERQNAAGMLRDLGLEEYDSWRIFTIVHRRPLDHCGFRVDEVEVLHDEPGRLDR